MNKNKKSYIEIMNELDKTLPSPSEFDYSNINKEEIIKKIISFLTNISPPNLMEEFYNFNSDNKTIDWDVKDLEGIGKLTGIIQQASYNLEKITNEKRLNEISELLPLPKSHQDIYSQIANIKEMIYDYILNYLNYGKYMLEGERAFDERFGETEEIEEYISSENIDNYIKKEFDMKRYSYESYNIKLYLFSVKDIMIHYGIKSNKIINLNEIESKLSEIMYNESNLEKDRDILSIANNLAKKVKIITKNAFDRRIKKDQEKREIQRRMQEEMKAMFESNDSVPLKEEFSQKK